MITLEDHQMNPAVKQLWVDALRSGQYIQAYAHLGHGPDEEHLRFCIMGVLNELGAQAGIVKRVFEWRPNRKEIQVSYHSRSSLSRWKRLSHHAEDDIVKADTNLHPNVATWAVLSKHATLLYDDHLFSLLYMNDALQVPFTEFADLIEEQL